MLRLGRTCLGRKGWTVFSCLFPSTNYFHFLSQILLLPILVFYYSPLPLQWIYTMLSPHSSAAFLILPILEYPIISFHQYNIQIHPQKNIEKKKANENREKEGRYNQGKQKWRRK